MQYLWKVDNEMCVTFKGKNYYTIIIINEENNSNYTDSLKNHIEENTENRFMYYGILYTPATTDVESYEA